MNGGTLKRVIITPEKAPIAPHSTIVASPAQHHRARAGSLAPHPADQRGRDHRGQGDEAADREVDAAGDDDHRHADREDRDDRDLVGDVSEVLRQQERGPAVRGGREHSRAGQRRQRLQDAPHHRRRGLGRGHHATGDALLRQTHRGRPAPRPGRRSPPPAPLRSAHEPVGRGRRRSARPRRRRGRR